MGELIDRLQSFVAAWADVEGARRSLASEPTSEEVVAAAAARDGVRAEVVAAQEQRASVEARLASAQAVSEEMARLAALAIPMLADQCPVCGQTIDAAHVEQELRLRATDTGTMLSLQGEVRQARIEVQKVEAAANQAETHLRELEDLRRRWDAHRRNEQAAEALFLAVVSRTTPVAVTAGGAEALAGGAAPALEFFRIARRRVLEFLNTLEQGLDRGAVERAESEVTSFGDALRLRARRLEDESRRAHQLKSLADAAVQGRVEVTEQRFKAVQPLVADIFSRLDPHPAFKTIEFELDTYYRRGTTSPMVRDLVEGVSADPLLVFSTSQANIAALSYFLAMGWSAGQRSLPFVLLDDPVQSMDDVNVLGFADLCRHLRRSRQLIISTLERRLARLLERKLAPRSPAHSTIVLDFLGWDRSGPTVEYRRADPQLLDHPIRVVQAAS
jgi:head-tail adaptor